MPNRATIEQLAAWLKTQDDIVLLGHINPDGDAVGSCFALWHALRAMGKRAVVCLPGGPVIQYVDVVPGSEAALDPADELPFAPKTALAVDVSDCERLGEAGMALFDRCQNHAVLDHHATNPGFGELYVLDGDAAAAGELVVDLIDALGEKLSTEAASCLFVAISTDCGNFNFPSTRAETFRAAAKCVEAGAAVDELTRRLYRERTLAETRLIAAILGDLTLSADGQVAWSRLTQDMLKEANATWVDNVNIVNYLLQVQGVRIAVLAEQRGVDVTKFSLRSNPPWNVARDVAVPLGGGGHDCAAGVTLPLPLEEALQQVLALATRAAKER